MRVEYLANRIDRVNRLRNYAIEQKNLLKKKQAELILIELTKRANQIYSFRFNFN